MNYRLTSAAEEEYADAAFYILQDRVTSALEFVEAVDASIAEIASDPERYAIESDNMRVMRIPQFRTSIFYEIKPDHVLILSISHDARQEGHWKDRV